MFIYKKASNCFHHFSTLSGFTKLFAKAFLIDLNFPDLVFTWLFPCIVLVKKYD